MKARALLSTALAALCALTVGLPFAQAQRAAERPPQFVVFNFDATPGPDGGRDFYTHFADFVAASSHGEGRITLFLNAQFFMLPHRWRPPRGSRWEGHPESYQRYLDPREHNPHEIPFARDPAQIEGRVRVVQELARRGHELSSHSTRHENGGSWDQAAWRSEFDEYSRYMHDLVGLEPPVGFRAPHLAATSALLEVEGERHMLYDASRPGEGRVWPRRSAGNVWSFPVPSFYFPRLQRRIIAFDDSYRLRHVTDAELGEVYLAEFEHRFHSNRAPLVISSHGPFAGASRILVRAVCGRPQVRCASFRQLAEYLNAHPPS